MVYGTLASSVASGKTPGDVSSYASSELFLRLHGSNNLLSNFDGE
jgi:hypothetical protein